MLKLIKDYRDEVSQDDPLDSEKIYQADAVTMETAEMLSSTTVKGEPDEMKMERLQGTRIKKKTFGYLLKMARRKRIKERHCYCPD